MVSCQLLWGLSAHQRNQTKQVFVDTQQVIDHLWVQLIRRKNIRHPIQWLLLSGSVALAKPPPLYALVTCVDYEVAGLYRETERCSEMGRTDLDKPHLNH